MKKITSLFVNLLIVTLLSGSVVLAFAKPILATAITPKTALIYGDSLTWESMWSINQQFKTKTGWKNYIHTFPSTSPCVWNTWLAQDLTKYQPSVVTIITDGNAYNSVTNSCLVDAAGNPLVMGSDAYYAKYQSDLDTFFATATATGATVVFVKAPPFLDLVRNAAVIKIASIAKTLAANYHGVSISGSVRTVLSNSGAYTSTKPCLDTETANMGCSGGIISIRTIVGTQTGLHLCPGGLPAAYPYFCSTYSSGEFRFGKALANTTVSPPAPILP